MCAVPRMFIYGLVVGILCCLTGASKAQQTEPTLDPFAAEAEPQVKAAPPSPAPEAVQPAVVLVEPPTVTMNSRRGVPIEGADSLAVAKIRRALDQEVEFGFVETRLADVVEYLNEAARIPILIDTRALDDVGLGSDTPVTISVKGVSLRSMLRLMLSELELTFVVRDEVLKITTPEEAENELAICVYPVRDFMENASPAGCVGMTARADALRTLLTASVAPDSWDHVGGAGTAVPVAPWGVLVVSQTTCVQEQVRGLLTAARRARGPSSLQIDRQAAPVAPVPVALPNPFGERSANTGEDPFAASNQPGAAPLAPPAAMLLKRYVLADGVSTDQVTQLITGIVNGASWQFPTTIFPVGNTLFIRQTEAAHVQIEELLRTAGLSYPVGMGGKGMPIQPQPAQPMGAIF